jgi:hypothetical protein
MMASRQIFSVRKPPDFFATDFFATDLLANPLVLNWTFNLTPRHYRACWSRCKTSPSRRIGGIQRH